MSGKTYHFLLVFDHAQQQLVSQEVFSDGPVATRAYTEAERTHAEDRFEIVLVGADSIETVMKTHGSYFGPSAYSEFLLTSLSPGA